MNTKLAHIALLIDDYDKAINYYTQILGFELLEDTTLSPEKRWVVIGNDHQDTCSILLAKAANEHQQKFIGNQSGGRVFLFLHTKEFDYRHQILIKNAVKIVNGPRTETYGRVLVFEDIYGNLWDLIEYQKSK